MNNPALATHDDTVEAARITVEHRVVDFRGIISAWPGGDVGFANAVGTTANNAKTMRQRNSIPPRYWPAIVQHAGEAEGFSGITLPFLQSLQDRRAGASPEAQS